MHRSSGRRGLQCCLDVLRVSIFCYWFGHSGETYVLKRLKEQNPYIWKDDFRISVASEVGKVVKLEKEHAVDIAYGAPRCSLDRPFPTPLTDESVGQVKPWSSTRTKNSQLQGPKTPKQPRSKLRTQAPKQRLIWFSPISYSGSNFPFQLLVHSTSSRCQ